MATTGVPNQLYQGTDAPDLVGGVYAGHTHEVSLKPTIRSVTSDPIQSLGMLGTKDLTIYVDKPDGKNFCGIGTFKCTHPSVIVKSFGVSILDTTGQGRVTVRLTLLNVTNTNITTAFQAEVDLIFI